MKDNLKTKIILALLITSFIRPILYYVNAEPTKKEDMQDYWSRLEKTSTEILTGEVISVSCRWINTTKSRNIYSFINLTVTDVKKTSLSKRPLTIEFVYQGGTVGDFSELEIVLPGGELYCYPGQKVKVYLTHSSKFDMFKAIKIEDLSPELTRLVRGGRSSLLCLSEDQGLHFKFWHPGALLHDW